VQLNDVMQYGMAMLADSVTLVSEIVPELISLRHGAMSNSLSHSLSTTRTLDTDTNN